MKLEIKNGKGVYTLIVKLAKKANLKVGCLGSLEFEKGWYAYTGSALGPRGLIGRIQRHLKKDKKSFWHIDYLLNSKHSSIKAIIYAKTDMKYECNIVREMNSMNVKPIKGFGASDCKEGCKSHLYYMIDDFKEIIGSTLSVYSNLNLMANFYLPKTFANLS
ncbi:MAG: GIY-YIG nuclease family protein [archaeon]|nr:GIY-YIG nuclease family protein [archaeon]MCP8316571.1 GIY-YIG nuclease family protein [archaeon]